MPVNIPMSEVSFSTKTGTGGQDLSEAWHLDALTETANENVRIAISTGPAWFLLVLILCPCPA